MLLYAITDRRLFTSREALLLRAAQWSSAGVDYVQIREKDLAAAELEKLAKAIVQAIKRAGSKTRVLLNGPVEISAAAGCDGVHLPSRMPASAIADVKAVFAGAAISVSCHTLNEVVAARDSGVTLSLFAPVFEKRMDAGTVSGQGLDALASACRTAEPMPVFALGGVTAGNAQECMRAGAAGIAAIRLFASDDEWVDLNSPM